MPFEFPRPDRLILMLCWEHQVNQPIKLKEGMVRFSQWGFPLASDHWRERVGPSVKRWEGEGPLTVVPVHSHRVML